MDENYPNNVGSFMDNEEREDIEAKETQAVISSVGAVEDILEWFDSNIAFFSDIDSLNFDESKPTESHLAACLAKRMKASYKAKRANFIAKFKDAIQEDTQA